jgi:hypothetical protein
MVYDDADCDDGGYGHAYSRRRFRDSKKEAWG